jgi:hypothetical protein
MGQERSEAQGLIVKMDMIRADFCLVPQDARLNQHNQSGTVSSCSRKCPNSLLYRQSSPCDVVNGPGITGRKRFIRRLINLVPPLGSIAHIFRAGIAYMHGRIFVTSLTCEGRGRMVHTIIRLLPDLRPASNHAPTIPATPRTNPFLMSITHLPWINIQIE